MRKTFLIIAIVAVASSMFASCASYRSSGKSGCKATQGYVGYGSR
jgi:predicted small secreted protein